MASSGGAPPEQVSAGQEVFNGPGTRKIRRKRVVTTAADREQNRLRAEDMRWKGAKTLEAKAWINSARLLREIFGGAPGEDDILAVNVGSEIRKDLCNRSEDLNLHVEMFDIQSKPDAPADTWIVIGRHRMSVAGKVRELQRQSKRKLREIQEQESEAYTGADDRPTDDSNIDPRIRGETPSYLPGIKGWALQGADGHQNQSNGNKAPVARMTAIEEPEPPEESTQTPVNQDISETNGRGNGSKNPAVSPRDVDTGNQSSESPAVDIVSNKQVDQEPEAPLDQPSHEEAAQDPAARATSEGHTDPDRTADWVSQQARNHVPETSRKLDPTGKWQVTCEGINEKYGSGRLDFSMNIYIDRTRPQSDNDTDDGNDDAELPSTDYTHNEHDEDIDENDMTMTQKARTGTYQMWATFDFGLYNGIIRFMAPNIRNTNQYRHSDFDLLESQLPSATNRTFQYKWRGREMASDAEINIEADQVTQWIRFEEDGVKLTGVFEGEFLGENAFEGSKVAKAEAASSHLGRLWSAVSPKAHEFEERNRR